MAFVVENVPFETEEEAKVALKEVEAIKYIRNQLDMEHPKMLRATYEQLVRQKVFTTPVGLRFLRELRELSEPKVDTPKVQPTRKVSYQKELAKYKKRVRILETVCVAMGIVIIGMFVITATSSQPTILNYEERIVDKYSSWEEELQTREKKIRQMEQKLDNGQ